MTQQHLPIWFVGQIDHSICDKLISEFSETSFHDASMGVDGSMKARDQRDTDVKFVNSNHWFEPVMESFALEANNTCNWKYETSNRENIQIARYKPGQHYDWHTDTFPLSGNPVDRKLTVVCLLNDDFEGGELHIRLYADYLAPLKKGTIIAFPSILEHKVTPVTNGVRYTAVQWLNGPRFR